MKPLPISNATRVLAKDQPEYIPLHICDQQFPDDDDALCCSRNTAL
ncbi:hypothetical protein [Mangrovicoccus sp. HB161399]|nr:hypothetical protein [Mangrovicoccus sp. HB161399]